MNSRRDKTLVALTLVAVGSAGGCRGVLGIEDWTARADAGGSASGGAGGLDAGTGAGAGGLDTGGSGGAIGTSDAASTAGGGAGGLDAGTTGGTGGATGGTGGATAGSAGTTGTTGGTGGATGGTGGATGGTGGTTSTLPHFSFFCTSMQRMVELSGNSQGFGGDLRYGEINGLTGADKICTTIAESSMPGSSAKQWRAFLSTANPIVHARDRIGTGPWYDRVGRLVAQDLTNLLQARPNADGAIRNDLPNEEGVPNSQPNPNLPPDDNQHFLTGSNAQGMLDSATATCLDWTTTSTAYQNTGNPRTGFSFVAGNRVNWIYGELEGGCGPSITGVGTTNGDPDPTSGVVASGGGYGGIYCFALTP